jgi:transient receptor potential cation channel subfamily M protein 2
MPDMECYLVARIILSLDILLWFFRSLHSYSFIRSLGPKIVMIKEMMIELFYFISIILVFIFAYGVSTQSLMYHNQELNFDLIKNVFYPAYFVIAGDYYEREKLMNGKYKLFHVFELIIK